jgi:hypothetical protein
MLLPGGRFAAQSVRLAAFRVDAEAGPETGNVHEMWPIFRSFNRAQFTIQHYCITALAVRQLGHPENCNN